MGYFGSDHIIAFCKGRTITDIVPCGALSADPTGSYYIHFDNGEKLRVYATTARHGMKIICTPYTRDVTVKQSTAIEEHAFAEASRDTQPLHRRRRKL